MLPRAPWLVLLQGTEGLGITGWSLSCGSDGVRFPSTLERPLLLLMCGMPPGEGSFSLISCQAAEDFSISHPQSSVSARLLEVCFCQAACCTTARPVLAQLQDRRKSQDSVAETPMVSGVGELTPSFLKQGPGAASTVFR